ncbi:MAG: copper chaperone PCu(A)C [Notoacmeibacter sp.]
MSVRPFPLSLFLLVPLTLNAAAACQIHEAKAALSVPAIDQIKTASMVMAEPVVLGDITIEGYWVRAMLPGQPVAGGFLKLTNKGGTDDRLVSASSPKSARMELHEMAMKGDVMEMREIAGGIIVPAGQTVELAPGGLHVMFFDIAETFKDGDTVPVTLTFEKAGEIELMLPVMAKAMSH